LFSRRDARWIPPHRQPTLVATRAWRLEAPRPGRPKTRRSLPRHRPGPAKRAKATRAADGMDRCYLPQPYSRRHSPCPRFQTAMAHSFYVSPAVAAVADTSSGDAMSTSPRFAHCFLGHLCVPKHSPSSAIAVDTFRPLRCRREQNFQAGTFLLFGPEFPFHSAILAGTSYAQSLCADSPGISVTSAAQSV
jgi:hypothetical protein